MFFDTHAHLNDAQFDPDREEVLRRAAERSVNRVVEIADAPADWEKAISLSRAHPTTLRCSLGLHPYYADQWRPELAQELLAKSGAPEVVAVGEIGLDYAKCRMPRPQQQQALLGMLEAAQAAALPVVLHCREAYFDLLPLLTDFCAGKASSGRFRGVVHCFSGSADDARQAAALGFALGVDGPVTYPKNGALREALREAGLERLVLETDSPYLPPQSSRGKRNEPGAIPEIAAALAGVFDKDIEEVARATSRNAGDLFRLTETR